MINMLTLKSHEEWLQKRMSYIGGSEASCIVGMNQYTTNVELWELKTGRRQAEDISDKPFVKYGTNAEEYLRELFKLDFPQFDVHYVDNNMWLNSDFPFAHASLDGWLVDKKTGRRGVLEIKTSNILQSLQKEKWRGRIPDNYYIQVLHYLMVTGFDFVILKAQLKYDYDGDIMLNTRHYKIEREEVLEDIKYLIKAEKEFSEYIKNAIKPPLVLPTI